MMEPVQHAIARGRILRSAVILSAAWGLLCGPAAGEEIRWRSGTAQMPRLDPSQNLTVLAGLLDQADSCHVVVQFDRSIGAPDRERFQRAGVELLRYVGSHAYFAVLSKPDFDARSLGTLPQMTAVRGVERAWKLHPQVLAGDVPSWAAIGKDDRGSARVAVYVLFHSDVRISPHGRAA
ncbi:MAG: hypothetical protein KJ749_02180, partial [Planctomycetes bacterium]|nr:hypothetical protein [Planctomycetota bacterium]